MSASSASINVRTQITPSRVHGSAALAETALARQHRAEVDDAIVDALVAALAASFQREPLVTVGSPSGSHHEREAASCAR